METGDHHLLPSSEIEAGNGPLTPSAAIEVVDYPLTPSTAIEFNGLEADLSKQLKYEKQKLWKEFLSLGSHVKSLEAEVMKHQIQLNVIQKECCILKRKHEMLEQGCVSLEKISKENLRGEVQSVHSMLLEINKESAKKIESLSHDYVDVILTLKCEMKRIQQENLALLQKSMFIGTKICFFEKKSSNIAVGMTGIMMPRNKTNDLPLAPSTKIEAGNRRLTPSTETEVRNPPLTPVMEFEAGDRPLMFSTKSEAGDLPLPPRTEPEQQINDFEAKQCERPKYGKQKLWKSENVLIAIADEQTMHKIGQSDGNQQLILSSADPKGFPRDVSFSDGQTKNFPIEEQNHWMKELLNLYEPAQCLEVELSQCLSLLESVENDCYQLKARIKVLELRFAFLSRVVSRENIDMSGQIDSLSSAFLDISGKCEEKLQVLSHEFGDLIEWMKSRMGQMLQDNAHLMRKIEDQENKLCQLHATSYESFLQACSTDSLEEKYLSAVFNKCRQRENIKDVKLQFERLCSQGAYTSSNVSC